ncbi:MAG: GNAT family N-acetyltransferase [Oscillospiraceae bacterium]|nr:GNAT family N-acetyltransferase [Oscillospiraceae bacterium]
MTEAIIRQVRVEDAAELAALWHRVFDDPEELALAFLSLLPSLGGGVCAEEDGKLLGAAYTVTDFTLGEKRAAYLYAIGVLPEARGRGLGKRLTKEAAALGRALGADFVCTLPANAPLYPWYEELIGVRCALYRREERIQSRPGQNVRPLSPEAYGLRREELLRGRAHVTVGPAALRYERENCRCFGGDLYALGTGIAAASVDEGETCIRELLAPEGEDLKALAASLGDRLGTEKALLLLPAAKGRPYLAADVPLPEGLIWNLTLD